ncbi:MAG: ribonuclease III [Candidatus Obscuribacterales bacterium]|nr:ribonuclease III [Candidatus Obscuribacterales bacterium]
MFFQSLQAGFEPKEVSLRALAHLGDAVFELFEREREILRALSAKALHKNVVKRVNASQQAVLLAKIEALLTESESDLVRRARNLKPASYRKIDQSVYRRSTAFEALIGYLYLTDSIRLKELLDATVDKPEP